MKFGKHLLSSALPEWLASYLDYKALKRAIKVQAQTGDTSLFDTLLSAEIKKADAFHKAREEDLLKLFTVLVEKSPSTRPAADEKTPLLKKTSSKTDVAADVSGEAWRNMSREEVLQRLDEVEALATNLLKFSALNYTGVSKSLKKSYKKTGISSEDAWLPRLHQTHFFVSRKCDEVLTKTTLIRRELKEDDRAAAAQKKIAQGGNGGSSSSSSTGDAADGQAPSLWAFILGTFIHQIADNANKLVVPLVYLQITSVGVMSILTGVMTLLQTFGTLPAGRWSSMIGPKALIQWITFGRAFLTTTLAIVFFFYTTGVLPSGLTLFLVTLITSADWFIRGAIDTARNVLPMAYSQNSKKLLDEINIRFFTVFELGALVGPLVQGILLALGWGLAVTLWVPVIFLVINFVVNFWIPEADSTKYSFLQSKDEGADGQKKNKKKPSLLESYLIGIKECIDPTIGLLFILVILLQLNKIRLVIPQIIAVELFNDDSYAAWIFSTYSLGGVIGSGVYALVKNTFTPATNMVFASAGVLILAVSWWPALAQTHVIPFLSPKDEWLLWVLLGAMLFSIVKQSARTSLQSIFQYALKDSKSAADIMALNRFGVNGLATGLRFALGIPFIFLSVTTAFLSISGGLAVIATVMFIGTYLLTKLPINNQNLKKDKDAEKEKEKNKEEGADSEDEKDKKIKKIKKKSSKKLTRGLSDEELAQLVDIPKNTGVLVVFEGLDGAGKSTQVERLKSFMQGEGYVSLVTTWSKSAHHYDLIRQLKRQTPMRSILLTVVQAMDFQQMIKQDVIPALRAKKVVLCDRYFYTGIARGVARGLSKTWLRQLFTADVNLEPDLVLYHQCVAAVAVSRVLSRSNSNTAQLSDDSMTHRVIVTLKSEDGGDKSRDLSAARISVYEAGLDVANPDLDPYDNFVAFQTRVSGQYDAMIPEYGFKVVDGTQGRDEQETKVRSYVEPMLANLKKEVLRPFKTNLFDKNPKLDSGKKVKEYYMTKDGLHWYFRTMYFPMRNRLSELIDLSKAPRVFLHGNPHINNFARFPGGSAMIDFDRTCIGPYVWDLVRLMVSTAFKQDGEDEIGGTFLRQGVLQRLKSGYEWGLLHKDEPSVHPQRNEPFLSPDDAPAPAQPKPFAIPPGVKGRLSMEILPSPELPHHGSKTAPPPPLVRGRSATAVFGDNGGNADPGFHLKRLEEMRKNHADLDDSLREMAATYLEALGAEGNNYVLVEAGVSPNWSGRTRTLLLFKKEENEEQKDKEVAEGEQEQDSDIDGMLVDIKPVRTDPDDKLFYNPYKPDYGKRMLKAQELYADGYIHHSATFFFKDVQYFAHEIPSIKVGVKRPLTEADQRDLLYAVGTQLGRGHAHSMQEGLSVSHILFHLNFSWPKVCEASERLKDELTSAYRRYLTVAGSEESESA